MTGHQIDNFVGSLVEMAKAFEERPGLHRQIHNQQGEINDLLQANADLRGSNDILREHIAALEAKIAEVTKERDDAGFRCLEADDKAARILDLARTLASGLGQVIAEVEPPKPQEPVLVPEGMTWGSSAADPTHVEANQPIHSDSVQTEASGMYGSAAPTVSVQQPDASQSEPFPSSPTVATKMEESSGSVSDTVTATENAPTGTATIDKPYAGKRYRDIPNYIPLSDWLAGGGTDADYRT